MKELSIEQKAKAYDEALEKAKLWQEHLYDANDKDYADELNYIFPELKDEDERIRKELHIYLDWLDGRNKDYQPKGNYTIKDMITWLEKQGEIIKEWSEMKINNIQTELQDMVDLKQIRKNLQDNSFRRTFEQRPAGCPEYCVMSTCGNCPNQPIVVKQSPADVSKQEPIDTTDLTDFEKCFKGMCYDKNQKFVKECCVSLLELARKQIQGELKPTEWSKEDNKKFCKIYSILSQAADEHAFSTTCRLIGDKECIELQDWLKSLEERIQPMQEWSEEDKKMLKEIISDVKFEGYNNDMQANSYRKINWLKSLRPQKRWKPSESDILLLERIASGESNPQDFQASLGGLIGQLKKLMEE